MKRRITLLSAILAASLTLPFVPRANADPPPWAGVYKHKHEKYEKHRDKHWRGDRDDWWDRRYRDDDRDDWHRRYGRYDRDDWRRWRDRDDDYWRHDRDRWYDRDRRYGWYDRSNYSPACNGLRGRIYNDRAKIAQIEPTGRHRKALQWYKDDLRDAYRDLARCGG
jgi:hypothetical protein